MPWGDLVELLGGSAIILAVLAVFWKGDDCISKEFRDDLAAWLILLKPPPGNSPVAQSVLAMFEKVFGERHWSWKCFWRSFVLSTVSFAVVLVFMSLLVPEVRSSLLPEQDEYWSVIPMMLLGASFNGLGDFPALYVTRIVLQKSLNGKISLYWAVIVDFACTIIIVFATTLMVVWFIYHILLLDPLNTPSLIELPSLVTNFLFGLFKNWDFQTPMGVAVLFTAFITSFWLWAAALGTVIIRLLVRSGPILNALQYVLPIEEKPIRSMGIVGFLVFFVYLLITITVRSF